MLAVGKASTTAEKEPALIYRTNLSRTWRLLRRSLTEQKVERDFAADTRLGCRAYPQAVIAGKEV